MKLFARMLAAAAVVLTLIVALGGPAGASVRHGFWRPEAVFVQTDNTGGNQIVAYTKEPDGSLTLAHTYDTGGLGGQLTGSVVDHLASQGSLAFAAGGHLLLAVNAGSNTVSVFAVWGDRLFPREIVPSGGTFPVSIAVRGHIVYVLNAERGGSLAGFWVGAGGLIPLPASTRQLGLNAGATPQFTNTPGEVAFSPDGQQLIVTTKANGNDIDVFAVGADGLLSSSPVVNAEPGTVPFAVTFDAAGHLVVSEASATDPALATFALHPDGTLSGISTTGSGQVATCWVVQARGNFYTSNAGSASLSEFQISPAGDVSLVGAPTATDPGTVDAAASPDGRFLYVQTGAEGIVDEFSIGTNGALREIGSVTVAGAAGGEGIVVSGEGASALSR